MAIFPSRIKEQSAEYSQSWSGFERVIHIYEESWVGISWAAKYLPGQHIAVNDRTSFHKDILNLVDVVVVHGMSDNIEAFLNAILKLKGSFEVNLVWHGTLSTLVSNQEKKLLGKFLEFARNNKVKSVTSIRFEQNSFFPKNSGIELLNSMPNINRKYNEKRFGFLIPSWNLIHKNLPFNFAVADLSKSQEPLMYYSDVHDLRNLVTSVSTTRLRYRNHSKHFELLQNTLGVLNVSLIDCQSMVDLEALASGCRLLRGVHAPIEKVVPHQIWSLINCNPYDLRESVRKLDALLEIPQQQWETILESWSDAYNKACRESWELLIL